MRFAVFSPLLWYNGNKDAQKEGDALKTAGIIAEYNPFHNGHKYHIEQAKILTGAERVIVVMSGNFVQRGEPAVYNKQVRTKAVLLNGADIVLELPVFYSTASAELFARAAVDILDKTNCVDFLCFGCESGSLMPLAQAADILSDESESFKAALKAALDSGKAFPAARACALAEACGVDPSIISLPNNILAIEYLKALTTLKSTIKPIGIRRMYTEYNSLETAGSFASATAVRNMIKSNSASVQAFMPYDFGGNSPVFADDLSPMLNYALRMNTAESLSKIYGITEGLENRIIRSAGENLTFTDIVNSVKTKRYTQTAIQRALLHTILNITAEDICRISSPSPNHYIRVLGFRRSSADLLSEICKKAALPIVTNVKSRDSLSEAGKFMLLKESSATDIYSLISPDISRRKIGLDITAPMVTVP